MSKDRIFTEDELKELTHLEFDRLEEGMANNEKCKRALKELKKFSRTVLFTYMDFTGAALAYIQEKLGDEGFEECCRRFGDYYMKDWYFQNRGPDEWMKSWKAGTDRDVFKEMVKEFAALMRQQSGKGFKSVEEDDEKIIFTVDPCRSGGRFRRQGMYRPPLNWPVIREPGPLTFNIPDFPYYCRHCAIIHARMPAEWGGAMWPVMLPPQKDDDPCIFLFYKDPKDTPDEYYARVGKKKNLIKIES